ncbi:MAG: NYN domain-containing protein [Gulosibacter sp.]|uniref:NYN domain-containing protein n=1 Tax=Gulosibacter sp. TaxID=2817531 RepID=UPI003F9265EC
MQPVPKPPQDRMIVYVDGFNLYHGMREKFGRSTLWLDLVQMAKSFRPKQQLVQVRYFTAPVLNDAQAQSRQSHYIDALERKYSNLIDVQMGRYQSKPMVCRKCGHTYTHYEEKETDVNIAVSLLTDAALHNMDTAVVVSADSDLAPAVRAAQKLASSLFVFAAFPPKRYSTELKTLMPSSIHLGRDRMRMQLPASFNAGGRTFTRPTYWS